MDDVNQIVNDFLRDSQFRVSELSIIIDASRDTAVKSLEVKQAIEWRSELILWNDMLYESRHDIFDPDYNFLTPNIWTDRDITAECEFLRQKTGMADVPYITFAGYSPEIRNTIIGEDGGTGLPTGNPGDYIEYNVSGIPQTVPFPSIGGMTTETIQQYFS